jgi:putative YphP/YqiW family bacilliredoxin
MAIGELMVAPMRRELTALGATELRSAQDVDRFMTEVAQKTALLVVNSVCGCAGGTMRPALARALDRGRRPNALASVFAGQDVEATARMREYITEYAPSSPSIALFRNGRVVYMLERGQIQGRTPELVADELAAALLAHC